MTTTAHETTTTHDILELDVAVIGAGFAGLNLAYRLRELDFDFLVFEAAPDVGGTWYWNRYPGARCDVESVDYTMTFSEELHASWDWSERFAAQPEILRYANFVADTLDLRRHVRFESQVVGASWDEADERWHLSVKDGLQVRARFVITAVGLLSATNTPQLPGLEDFEGRVLHSAHWPHEPVDFTGRRVAIIGTGSTGIQIIPEIAPQTENLTVFQRTANFSIPARNRPLTGRERERWRTSELDFIRSNARDTFAGYFNEMPEGSILAAGEDERKAELDRRWQIGGTEFLGAYADTAVDLRANEVLAEYMRERIREVVTDPETARILEPHTHPVGSKRPTLNSHYFETFNLPNVDLVDATATPITKITATAIHTEDAEYPIDDLILATGFDAVSGPYTRMGITGVGGLALTDAWSEGARSYLGLAMAGFPNLFTVTGPLSATPLTNVLRSIEHHVEWITDLLEHTRDNGIATVAATPEAEEEWDRHVDAVGEHTLHKRIPSWYTGGNIEGKPLKLMAYVGGLHTYRSYCEEVVAEGYRGFVLSSSAAQIA